MRQLNIEKHISQTDYASRNFKHQGPSNCFPMTDETRLLRQIKNGDLKALEALVIANYHLVVCVAKRFQNNGLSLHDLIIRGNRGFNKAAEHFDETKGFMFTSYAIWCTRNSILQAIVENSSNKPIPLNKIGLIQKGESLLTQKLNQYFQQEPGPEEIAAMQDFEMKIKMDSLRENSNQISGIKQFIS